MALNRLAGFVGCNSSSHLLTGPVAGKLAQGIDLAQLNGRREALS